MRRQWFRETPRTGNSPVAGRLPERLLAWSVLAFVAAAISLLLVFPGTILGAGERASFSALVHLLTLGGLLGGYHALQAGGWRRLYGREPVLPAAAWLVLGFHVAGVGLLGWGFFHGSTFIANLGGHYLVPTAIVLSFAQGVATLARRPARTPRHLAAHLPGLGLLATMALGALLVMDAYSGQYGIYTPQTILVHMLSGAFLFFLPLMLLQQMLEGREIAPGASGAAAAPGGFSPTARLLPPAALAGLGVLTVALAEMGGGAGQPWARPVGLAMLGGVALWIGLPAFGPRRRTSLRAVRRSIWGAFGLLLLFAAIRAWRGMGPAEIQGLARAAVILFLFGVAVPEVLSRLAAGDISPGGSPPSGHVSPGGSPPSGHVSPGGSPPSGEAAIRAGAVQYTVLLLGAGLILAAQLGDSPNLGRAGAVLWGLCVGWQAGVMAGLGRR